MPRLFIRIHWSTNKLENSNAVVTVLYINNRMKSIASYDGVHYNIGPAIIIRSKNVHEYWVYIYILRAVYCVCMENVGSMYLMKTEIIAGQMTSNDQRNISTNCAITQYIAV